LTDGYVIPQDNAATKDPQVAGSKASALARLRAIAPVPEFFAVTTAAFQAIVVEQIPAIEGSCDPSALRKVVLEELDLPASFRERVACAVRNVISEHRPASVAVRSSAIAEDLPDASFAGQYVTVLGVPAEEVERAIRRCWASAFAESVLKYQQSHNLEATQAQMGVLVQRQLDPKSAGVIFTRNPVSGEDELVIEASFGLGESVVSGIVTPDLFLLSAGGVVTSRELSRKVRKVALTSHGTEVREVDTASQRLPSVTDDQVAALYSLASAVKAHVQSDVDIEWCIDDQGVWLLQARPITAISPSKTT
jgi:phosphoenolpyruvate synthase/pyruvate phosphate dikinase